MEGAFILFSEGYKLSLKFNDEAILVDKNSKKSSNDIIIEFFLFEASYTEIIYHETRRADKNDLASFRIWHDKDNLPTGWSFTPWQFLPEYIIKGYWNISNKLWNARQQLTHEQLSPSGKRLRNPGFYKDKMTLGEASAFQNFNIIIKQYLNEWQNNLYEQNKRADNALRYL